ncbi:MAG: TonB-dependent receptor [Pirellulales bacterium]|nr:TonB-dependent receptor [Pirellulales bacterium]
MSRLKHGLWALLVVLLADDAFSAPPASLSASLSSDWIVADDCLGDALTCNCPGCTAYRVRLEQAAFVSNAGGVQFALQNPTGPDGVVLTQAPEPVQPLDVQPTPSPASTVETPSADLGSSVGILTSLAGFPELGQAADPTTESVQVAQTAPGGSVVSAQAANLMAPPETATILRDSGPTNAVTLQRRNPVSYDPHVRGFRYGQILSRVGGVWSPVRQDLDSPISKLDPNLIEDIAVIPGPYASRFGPAFAFIDVETLGTPRYQCGYESHATVGETYRENGDHQHGRVTTYGGGTNWGFIGHYGSRTGSDYRSGNGTLIPSSYNNQSFLGQIGFDLSPSSKVEVRYDRLDQNDAEYALQFFDIDYLGNDSSSIRYVDTDPGGIFSQADFSVWYNRTRYHGDNQNASKAPVRDRVQAAIPGNEDFSAFTFGDRMLTGGRSMWTIGDLGDVQNRIGADYRFEDQEIEEDYTITQFGPPTGQVQFFTNLPKSWLNNAGVFNELVLPMSDDWTTTLGARADFVDMDARVSDLRPGGNITQDQVSQADTLYGFYLLNDVVLTPNWTSQFGFGHAQRNPTLVERYSDGVFLGLIQSGFSRVIGDPNLNKERLWQIDWSVSADYDRYRGRAALFNSWVLDFSTYRGNVISSPDGARLLYSTNTELATLAGFELYGEADSSDYVTLFSGMNYVQGTDQQIDAPLWGVAPLIGRVGVRLHDGNRGQTWGLETSLRMVDRQDRAGVIRNAFDPTVLIPIEQPTPGFSTVDLRGYYNVSRQVSIVSGVENLLDKNSLEHLDLRLPAQGSLPAVAAFSPGIMFYTGIEITN